MPNTYHPRPAPCTHCGDKVLVVEETTGRLFGLRLNRAPRYRLEHAGAGLAGEVFDGVDDECHRPPVR